MGIFSRKPKESQLISMLENLKYSRDCLRLEMHDLASSKYKDEHGAPTNGRLGAAYLAQDELARKELVLFLDDFLAKDWHEVTTLNQATPKDWEWVLLPLMKALQIAIIEEASGKNRKVNLLQAQGVKLSPSQRVFYILPQVSEAIEGLGLPPVSYEDWPAYKIADNLLLTAIIQVILANYEMKGQGWLKDSTWYFSTLYSEYMQWSHREGPFKRYLQSKA